MSLEKSSLAVRIAEAAWEKKAFDLVVLDVGELLQITDFFVIASGRSDRHVLAISESIEQALKAEGRRALSVEGRRNGQWICMDYDDVVVHLFLHEWRGHYDLDGLWSEAERLELETPSWVVNSDDQIGFLEDDDFED